MILPRPTFLLGLAALAGLAGCAIDDATGEVKGPVFVGQLVATGAARSRVAPRPPPAWDEICARSFAMQWKAPRPAPDGLATGGAAGLAVTLRLTGAAYGEAGVDADFAAKYPSLFPQPGRYRVRRRDPSPACDALLDRVIAAGSRAEGPFAQAAACLSAERVGPPLRWDAPYEAGMAPYAFKGLAEQRDLGGGFQASIFGQALIDRRTGQEIVRRMTWASLQWREPDEDHLYWGAMHDCGPSRGHGRLRNRAELEMQPLFAAPGGAVPLT